MNDLAISKSEFGITLCIKGKHAGLHKAVKAMGSAAAVARHLGVTQSEFGAWYGLKRIPNINILNSKSRWNDTAWRTEIEQKLLALTGELLEDLFPESLRNNREFLESDKYGEVELRPKLLSLAHAKNIPMTIIDHSRLEELKDTIGVLLKTLSYREREIIKLRFGLEGGQACTYESIGHIHNVTRERIRQIEKKAIRKLQQPIRSSLLKEAQA